MATETESAFFNHSMDLPMDGSFPNFADSDNFVDPRLQSRFDQTLTGKDSPGSSSQFLLTPSALWERPSYDDGTVDIFADLPDLRDDGPEHAEEPIDEPVKIKEEDEAISDTIVATPAPSRSTNPRRSSRATSSSSSVRNSSDKSDKSSSATTMDSGSSLTKVKKSQATTRKTQARKKRQAKEKLLTEEDERQLEEDLQPEDESLLEDDSRRNKFLERNRVAASKCRQKKKEWMHSLEETKADLEKRHGALHETLNGLAAEISVMKNHLMMHANCGDQNIDRWFESEARRFVASKTTEVLPPRRQSASSASAETQHSRHSSIVQFSPSSSIMPPLQSPEVKAEAFSYDYMPDDMFADASL